MSEHPPENALVLLSGGLDSATALGWALAQGFQPLALTFAYGQRHSLEIEFARIVAEKMGVAHRVVELPRGLFLHSALTDSSLKVPEEPQPEGIPITYVPARNLVFLALASALAESLGIHELVVGANAIDFSGYPDCRRPFFDAFERTVTMGTRLGQEHPWRVHTPLIAMRKAEIIRLGIRLKVPYEWTTSCYQPAPRGVPCMRCDSCRFRAQGFREAGHEDPLLIRLEQEGLWKRESAGKPG